MKVNLTSLTDREGWARAGVRLPAYDVRAMRDRTGAEPTWVHFGAGNIFRAYIAALQQRLLDAGVEITGIVAADTFDVDNIRRVFGDHDNLTLNVTLNADATIDKEILASVAEALVARPGEARDWARLCQVFAAPTLQIVSFTITEKGYGLRGFDGAYLPDVQQDLLEGPANPRHAMSIACALLLQRYLHGAFPLAVVSMDNCSHNGEKLRGAILEVAKRWEESGFVPRAFIEWISNEACVAFPWTMIDKITPRPSEAVERMLEDAGIEEMKPIKTDSGTFVAPFANAERAQYLVIEDRFPAGRPALERAGVYLTDRDTVNRTERMKVTTCLNPLHTALAVYGCLLGYTLICEEMKDADLARLVRRLGYDEGLPVVTDPGILRPRDFIDEVVEERLPNPFMPDAPQRIATDTSQKVGIRFGETIRSYVAQGRDLNDLIALPLAIAGWLRYLLAFDDEGREMERSADPLLSELSAALSGVRWNDPDSLGHKARPILSNAQIFGSDLMAIGLGERIEGYLRELLAGKGAVRETLRKHIMEASK